MKQRTTIELYKENMKFSAGHFTIFSATEREPLHGHNYNVYLALTAWVEENGLSFDYRYYKEKVYKLCKQLSQTFLMPTQSQYLSYEEDETYYYFYFNDKKIPFLKEDITLIPLSNITVEELSLWFIKQLTQDNQQLEKHHIEGMVVKVFSGPGQSGSASWTKEEREGR